MEFQDKIFRHNLIKAYRIILAIALVAAVAVAIKIRSDSRVYSRSELVQRMEKPGSVDSIYGHVGENLLCYSMDGVSAYDKNGSQLWNQTYQMQNAMVDIAGSYVAAADYQGTKIYLCGPGGLQGTIDTSVPILAVRVSEKGMVMAQLLDGDTVFLRMYSADGTLITNFRTTMRNFGYPAGFCISPDNTKVGVAFMKAVSGQVATSVAFYNFTGVGQNETDNLVSAYECEDETVPYITFLDDETAVSAGNKKIRIFSGKQKPVLKQEIETQREIKAIYTGKGSFVTVNDSDGSGYDFHVYDKAGNEKLSFNADFEYTDVYVDEGRILVYNQTRFKMVGFNGVVKYDGELSGGILKVIPVDRYASFLVVYDDKMERVRLR